MAAVRGRAPTRPGDFEHVEEALQRRIVRYDKKGDQHYDVISAFIKSVRGSDPDAAALLADMMLEAGEDPEFIARRMMVFASEDVGLADPGAGGGGGGRPGALPTSDCRRPPSPSARPPSIWPRPPSRTRSRRRWEPPGRP